eukprot:421760-Prymnesium_polylepis.1
MSLSASLTFASAMLRFAQQAAFEEWLAQCPLGLAGVAAYSVTRSGGEGSLAVALDCKWRVAPLEASAPPTSEHAA